MLLGIFLNRGRKTIVFIDTYSHHAFNYALFCSLLCKIIRVKYIPILRGGNLPHRLKKNPYLTKIIFANSIINISPSKFLKIKFKEHGFKSKYIPNIIDIKVYPFQLRRNCNPKLLWVRSMHKSYNPQMAVIVLSELIKIYPNATLNMVGPDKDGSSNKCVQLARKLGVEKSILLTGGLKKSSWTNLSKECDIFINTTNYDNMPVSVIEAMALGLPIVSTNAGGLKYLLNDGEDALLVPRNDIGMMVKKITLLFNNPYIAINLSLNARKNAEEYSWEKVRLDWLKLLSFS